LRKALGLGIVVSLALGCGSAGGSTSTGSGLKGRVMRGPTTPVCRVGVPCEEPARGVKLSFIRSGKVVARATTSPKGFSRGTLRRGVYSVRTDRRVFGKVPQPSRVTVPSDRYKRVDFHIDTGIR
jgi:hypothetical protein